MKVLKIYIITFFIMFLNYNIIAQELLKANAGIDQHFCFATDWISTTVGGNPTATGGTPPYTYNWTTNLGNMIDAPTNSNPTISFLGNIIVYVEVTDFVGNIAKDTTIITMSTEQLNFSDNPQDLQINYYINSGDSVFLTGNVLALNSNSTFMWSPCESIIDNCTVSDGFWAKPNTTTTYNLTATDEFNCSETFFTHFYKVYVNHIGININNIDDNISVFPNPVKDHLNFKEETQVEIFDIQGRTILKSKKPTKSMNISGLNAGVYFVKFNNNNKIEKFVKE